jgi:hypothetical protein
MIGLALAACQTGRLPGQGGRAQPAERPAAMTTDVEAFMSQYLGEFERLEHASALGYWRAANSGKPEDWKAYAEADLALKKLHSDPVRYARIVESLKRDIPDPLLRRSLEVALLAFKGNQLPEALLEEMVTASSEIEQLFNTFRATFDGKEMSNNALLEALKNETESDERRQIWEGLKQVGAEVAPKLRDLAVLRNRAAARLGITTTGRCRLPCRSTTPGSCSRCSTS